jgi:NitT/TauT family transport system permease protein
MQPPPGPRPRRWIDVVSLPLLVLLWQGLALAIQSRFLPTPVAVTGHIWQLAWHGHLIADFLTTLARAFAGFAVAMTLGTAIGLALGRVTLLDRLFAPWIVVGLNIPAIVVAIICYIWLGLTEFALVLAVVINKLPLVVTTIREGVRSFLPDYDELAEAFRMPAGRRLRLIFVPQLMPFILAAARTGLSLVWKIVLVFEVLGSDGGVGFRVALFFQFFDMLGILAYTLVFITVVMVAEYGLLRPLERRVLRWRRDPL